MRITTTLLVLLLLLSGCNSVKRNQRFLAQGDYDQVIELAARKLQKDKSGKNSSAHIAFLEAAFARAVEDDQRRIDFLKKEGLPSNSREIYYLYCDMDKRQELVRPLLPLNGTKIDLKNYSDAIITSKKKFAEYLYAEGSRYLQLNNTLKAREAFGVFNNLKSLQSNYPGVDQKLQEARFMGTDFVIVALNNNSEQIIPYRLERELLDFNTFGLDDFWTEYHNKQDNGIGYNFGIDLNFNEINISPERISEQTYTRKKVIKDGWEYVLDRYGNVVKDSLGNDVKVDKIITVFADVTYTEQKKSVRVGGNAVYKDLLINRILNKHPLETEFLFENTFARFQGDERALTPEDLEFLKNSFFPFPANPRMVLDAGEEIKVRLKEILKSNHFR